MKNYEKHQSTKLISFILTLLALGGITIMTLWCGCTITRNSNTKININCKKCKSCEEEDAEVLKAVKEDSVKVKVKKDETVI